jgi:hypothetical protein
MVYDSARTALVEFGGAHSDPNTGTSFLGQTWDLADADHLEIVRPPGSLLLVSNQVVRFTLTVRGALPMTFQWRKNQANLVDGGKISGSRTGTLTISNADRNSDVGLYDVLVQNACGSLFSTPAALVFTNAPHVDSISGGGTNSVCGAATLHASVSGSPPYNYQWRRNGVLIAADPFTSGVTTDTLTLDSLRLADTGNYDVLVTDVNAPAVNTGLAVIQVLAKPWTLVGTNGPSPRDQFGLAYDSRRGVTVLFGGASQNSLSRETWEWNGNTWSLRATNGPSPRYGVLMAYDTDRGRTLCFGGNIASTSYNYNYPQELWEWDGLTWTLRTTGGAPGRIAGGCAYDSAAHKFVVFGGFGVAGASPGKLFDTWEYDAAAGAWTKVADGPTAPFGGAIMAFDSTRNKRVLISSGPTIYDKDLRVFEWAATKWVEQSVLPDPLAGKPNRALVGEAIAYHPARGMVVINNGKTDSSVYSRSTWGYDGTSWRVLSQNDGPPANESAGMAYDSGRNALVEFGGATGATLLGQTWELPNSDRVQILQQPFSTAVAANQLTRFVVVAGGAPPLRFQWRKDGGGLADGPGISGATTGTLTITNANPLTDAGSYDVLVSNDCGSVPSATAILAFIAPSLRLGLTPSPGAIVLTWSAPNMVLQSAPAPAGPWQTVLGATSPYPVVLNEGQLFFRLVSQ